MLDYEFKVQEKKRIRVILDTDAACEADDQYAIVHALLTPRFIMKGIIAEQFREENSVDKSYNEILKLCRIFLQNLPYGLKAVKHRLEDDCKR